MLAHGAMSKVCLHQALHETAHSIRQHPSAYVSIRQHTSALCLKKKHFVPCKICLHQALDETAVGSKADKANSKADKAGSKALKAEQPRERLIEITLSDLRCNRLACAAGLVWAWFRLRRLNDLHVSLDSRLG